LLVLAMFWVGCPVYAHAGLDCNPPIYGSHASVMIGMFHYARLYLLSWGLTNVLPRLVSNSDPTNLYFLSG
jgi:hypothetical protein